MTLLQFIIKFVLVTYGLVINSLNYFGWLHQGVWTLWENFIAIDGFSILLQVRTVDNKIYRPWWLATDLLINSFHTKLVSWKNASAYVGRCFMWLFNDVGKSGITTKFKLLLMLTFIFSTCIAFQLLWKQHQWLEGSCHG